MKRELTIEIPLLMTADGDRYLIASNHLGIFIQADTQAKAKKMFETSADMLFNRWEEQNRLISKLKAGGLIKKDDVIIEKPRPSAGSIQMPNLTLGHYENAHVAVC